MYKIYGDYGMSTQNFLEEFPMLEFARNWVRGYTRWGDFGGYENIYIVNENGYIYQALYAEENENALKMTSKRVLDFNSIPRYNTLCS